MAKKPSRPAPAWFTVRFDQTSEWAALRVPDEHIGEWLLGAARLFNETTLWDELVEIQAILLEQIKQRDWTKVSPWHLVHHVKVAHDMKVGAANFLPANYRSWPPDVRQALYLAHFLMKGHAMVEDNPAEDFGLRDLAQLPAGVRPVLAAVKPLWHGLAELAVRAAIAYHRSHHEEGFDAGLLKLMMELGESPDATSWLMLMETTPKTLLERIEQSPKLQKADHHYVSREPEGNVPSEAFFALSDLLKHDSAATALVRAMQGVFDTWPETVRQNVQRAKQELVITFDDTPTWVVNGGFPDADAIQKEADLEHACSAAEQFKQILQEDIKLPTHLRQLLELLLKDSNQSNVSLGSKLKKSSATIGNWKRELAARYPNLH